jgi:hypothetical protein
MLWLLDLFASRGLRASLEIVPYLLALDEPLLNHFDPKNSFFEVSQHGYAHLPRSTNGGRRHEFAPDSAFATEQELTAIGEGKRRLTETFPNRFTGGFSPPFDALPAWLPETWHTLGGAFVSCLFTNSVPGAPLPVVRAGIDVWNWTFDRAIPRHRIRRRLEQQAAIDGHIGLVLHPRCLRSRSERARLVSILDFVERTGIITTSVRELAQRTDSPTQRMQSLRSRLRSIFTGARSDAR